VNRIIDAALVAGLAVLWLDDVRAELAELAAELRR
jgi:hypothetical protein